MGVRKEFKIVYSNPEQTDEIRQMMIASANYSDSLDSYPEVTEFVVESDVARKRKRRLDYLSPEEKLMHKKLKNREAAQNSRDKKKAYVTTLEITITQLQDENLQLKEHLKTLVNENEKLKLRNVSLEEKLRHETVDGTNLETAALQNPLPKDLVPAAVLPLPPQRRTILTMASYLTLMILTGWITSQTLLILKSWRNWLIPYNKKHWNLRNLKTREKQWWGPNQKCWNPIAENVFAKQNVLLMM